MIDWWGPIIYEYYGGTEGNGIAIVNSQEWLAHPGTVGRTLVGEIHILDEDGQRLPPARSARVYFSRRAAMFAYHNDPEKTARALQRRRAGRRSATSAISMRRATSTSPTARPT